MKLSIITTFYNSSDHIAECIDSVQGIDTNWTYEHILVNDGSNDETLEIIANAKSSNHKVIGKYHIGRGPALNLGLKHASGDYICILDSDDLINPSWINFFFSNIENHNNSGVYYGLTTSDINKFKFYDAPNSISKKILNPIKILFYNPICHSGTIFKHSSINRINGYSTSIKSQFDWDLWIRLSLKSEIFTSLNYLAAYKRIHENQSFESKQHILYTLRGVYLQLNAVFYKRFFYFLPVLIFSFIRVIWSLLPRKIRTSKLLSMIR